MAVVVRGVAVVVSMVSWALASALATPVAAAQAAADLAVTAAGPTEIEQGTSGRYLVSYTNNGPQTATNAGVTVTIDSALDWDAFYTTGNCIQKFPVSAARQWTIVCTLGDVQPGSSGSFWFVIRAYDSTAAGTYKAMFAIASDVFDNKQQNNTSVYHIGVVAPYHADVQTDFPQQPYTTQPFYPGESVTIGTQFANNGPAVATNVVETFTLPASFSFDPSNSDPRCAASGQTVTCALGTVGVDTGTNWLDISFFVGPDGTYTVSGSITADQPDPVSANNTGTIAIYVTA